jgi:hypothetical protein
VSWTLNDKKRRSDSINTDFVVALILPAIALAHLFLQIRSYPGDKTAIMTTQDPKIVRVIHGIEAPFTITEIFMPISLVFLLLETWMKFFRRALAIALVGLMCYSIEWYAHFSVFRNSNRIRNFRTSFAAESLTVLLIIAVLMGICVLAATFLTTLFFLRGPTPTTGDSIAIEGLTLEQVRPRAMQLDVKSGKLRWLRWLSVNIALMFGSTTMTPGISQFFQILPSGTAAPEVLQLFFPRTSSSLSDLDQAVAALGGATVIAFAIYSVASSWYKDFVAEASAVMNVN